MGGGTLRFARIQEALDKGVEIDELRVTILKRAVRIPLVWVNRLPRARFCNALGPAIGSLLFTRDNFQRPKEDFVKLFTIHDWRYQAI